MNLAAELATAEQNLLHDSSLAALTRAVQRVATARDAMATALRDGIEKTAELEALRAAVEAARHGPGPTKRMLLRYYAKLRRAWREDLDVLRLVLDVGFVEPEALRFEVSLVSHSE